MNEEQQRNVVSMALSAIRIGDHKKAKGLVEREITNFPDDYRLWLLLAVMEPNPTTGLAYVNWAERLTSGSEAVKEAREWVMAKVRIRTIDSIRRHDFEKNSVKHLFPKIPEPLFENANEIDKDLLDSFNNNDNGEWDVHQVFSTDNGGAEEHEIIRSNLFSNDEIKNIVKNSSNVDNEGRAPANDSSDLDVNLTMDILISKHMLDLIWVMGIVLSGMIVFRDILPGWFVFPRLFLSFVFVTIFSGFLFQAAIYPYKGSISTQERIILAFSSSMVLISTGIILNRYATNHIDLWNLILIDIFIVFVTSLILFFRVNKENQRIV